MWAWIGIFKQSTGCLFNCITVHLPYSAIVNSRLLWSLWRVDCRCIISRIETLRCPINLVLPLYKLILIWESSPAQTRGGSSLVSPIFNVSLSSVAEYGSWSVPNYQSPRNVSPFSLFCPFSIAHHFTCVVSSRNSGCVLQHPDTLA